MTDFTKRLTKIIFRPWFIVFIGMIVILPGLGRIVVTRHQELRVILTARDMAEGGSWLVPHYLGNLRLRKPPLMYWIVASGFRAASSTESTAVARLPGAIAGILLLGVTYFCGAHLIGRKRAALAALALATAFFFIRHARLAETDVTLTLFTTVAICSGFFALTRYRPWLYWPLAGLAGGLGFMIKGPAALALPVASWVIYAVTRREDSVKHGTVPALQKIKRHVGPILLAIVIFAAIASPWYIMLWKMSSEQSEVGRQLSAEINATFDETHHPGPFYYYAYSLPHRFLPWGLLIPPALVSVFRRGRHHRGVHFLLAWFISSFLALSLTSSKQGHYCTLLLPQAALILGYFLYEGLFCRRSWERNVVRYFLWLLALLLAGAGIFLFIMAWTNPVALDFGLIATGLILTGLAVYAAFMKNLLKQFMTLLCSIVLVALSYVLIICPTYENENVVTLIADEAAPYIKTANQIIVVGPYAPSFEYYLHRRTIRPKTLKDAFNEADDNDLIIALSRKNRPLNVDEIPMDAVASVQKRDTKAFLYIKK